MNKQEIWAAITAKFSYVEIPDSPAQEFPEHKYYLVKWRDHDGDTLKEGNQAVMVYHEGEDDEKAMYYPSEPKPTPSVNPQAELITFIDSKVADKTIESGSIVSFNQSQGNAVVNVVKEVGGELKSLVFLVDKYQGSLRLRQIGG